jgi:hypothetical protein
MKLFCFTQTSSGKIPSHPDHGGPPGKACGRDLLNGSKILTGKSEQSSPSDFNALRGIDEISQGNELSDFKGLIDLKAELTPLRDMGS